MPLDQNPYQNTHTKPRSKPRSLSHLATIAARSTPLPLHNYHRTTTHKPSPSSVSLSNPSSVRNHNPSSAVWLLNEESEILKRLWVENGSKYEMVFAGHSLGSGVAALLTVIVVNHRDRLGGIPRDKIRCYAAVPTRCMSLNLAIKYADVIYSVVL